MNHKYKQGLQFFTHISNRKHCDCGSYISFWMFSRCLHWLCPDWMMSLTFLWWGELEIDWLQYSILPSINDVQSPPANITSGGDKEMYSWSVSCPLISTWKDVTSHQPLGGAGDWWHDMMGNFYQSNIHNNMANWSMMSYTGGKWNIFTEYWFIMSHTGDSLDLCMMMFYWMFWC